MAAMVPIPQYACRHGHIEFRIVPAPVLPLPPDYVLLYCLCPCGAHRAHFTIHRNVLFNQMGSQQPIQQNVREQPHLHRFSEMQQTRYRRRAHRKENETIRTDSDQEDDIDR